MKKLVKEWNEKYFDNKLSDGILHILDEIDESDAELISFIDSIFYNIHLAEYPPYDFSEQLATEFARKAKFYMPSRWSRIPSATQKNRMKYVDSLIENLLTKNKKNINFLDAACGYPPVTTIELSERFPNWNIIGIDPNFPDYVLTDESGVPAGFDSMGHLMFVQTTWKKRLLLNQRKN